ncbi:MAG: hypothetical protein LBG52_01910 [Candidatus Peribacteria bacterium]|jgi:hypothetical protein|nr:hypothetical protein [Candidatus Peribacteria bacterium]
MTKQGFIITVLDLIPDREMGWGIKAMVENNQLDDHAINVLVVVLKKAVDKLNDVAIKYKMYETIKAVDEFNAQKNEQKQKDASDLAKLDSMLDNF